jgi:hypothetical protein
MWHVVPSGSDPVTRTDQNLRNLRINLLTDPTPDALCHLLEYCPQISQIPQMAN